MAGNSFGKLFRITTFGESHGLAVGGVIDGCPPGLPLDIPFIQRELQRRRPGQSKVTSTRDEKDEVILSSGIINGNTTGTPIAFWVINKDHRPEEYDHLKSIYRPSHADLTYEQKYGIRDHRGGGRSSARETLARVVGGAVAKQVLQSATGIIIQGYVSAIGPIEMDAWYKDLDLESAEQNVVRCPDQATAEEMIRYLDQLRKEGDTTGGVITCIAKNILPGLGEPVFEKLQALLAHAILSIPAVKGFEFGSGFAGTRMKGSEHNDPYALKTSTDGSRHIYPITNRSGGIQGGISSGEDIYFRVAFKPVSTIAKEQETYDNLSAKVMFKGPVRQDPCPVPRAVVIVEAMTALVLVDCYLLQKRLQ